MGDGVEKLEEAIRQVKEAQKKYATYTQEQVDAIFRAAACAADQARIPLAQKDGEEAGLPAAVKDQACQKKPRIAQTSVLFRTTSLFRFSSSLRAICDWPGFSRQR